MGLLDRLFGTTRGSSAYRKGVRAENKVKASLQRKGWVVRKSKGSRGPYDLYALRRGRKLLVQVKSGTASPTREELRQLRATAKRKGAHAMVTRVRNGKITPRFV